MKIRNYYISGILVWIYLYFPLEKWFDIKYFTGKDVYLEIKSKRKSKKEDRAIDVCRKFLDEWFCEHVSIIGDGESYTVYLYRDEYFNDEIISKIQDIFGKYPNFKVKVVYDWEEK